MSFGHGANDAQKTMGIIAALLVGTGHLAAGADGNIAVPVWVEFSAYGAIAFGTIWGGWKIIETMGLKITTLHASSGVAANAGAVTAIFGATGLGVPISTTHAAASSVAGAGVASGVGINLKVVGEMVMAWIITLPSTLVVGFLAFKATQLPGAFAWIVTGAMVLVAAGLIVWAMSHSITAEDVEAEIPERGGARRAPPAAPRTSRATARPPEVHAPLTPMEGLPARGAPPSAKTRSDYQCQRMTPSSSCGRSRWAAASTAA